MNLYRRCLLSNVSLCVTRATSQLGDTLVRNTLGHHLCTRNICVSPAASLRGVSALKLAPLPCVTVRGHCVPSNERGAVRGKLVMKSLPYFCRGEVIRGFGRGSKELGIPTANFPDSVVDNLPADISTGIYYGWACLGNGDVHKMVMSIGWNPYYKNTKKSMETHVIHPFKDDFYGEILSVVMVGYIRPERSYDSLDALITAINNDIEEAKVKLELPEHLKLKEDNFFTNAPSLPSSKVLANSSTSQTIMNGH